MKNTADWLDNRGFIIFMMWSCTSLILDFTEIILFACHKLQPITYLVLNVVKMSLWLILLFLNLASFASRSNTATTSSSAIQQLSTSGGFIFAVIVK